MKLVNERRLSEQDDRYIESIEWYEMKIDAFVYEVKLVQESKNAKSNQNSKEKTYSDKEEYDIYKDLKNIFNSAKKSILIVDPYVDETLYSLYIDKISSEIKVRILTKQPTPVFIQVGEKLAKKRFIKIVDSRLIHDRCLFVDDKCWVIGSSIKDAAKSKPTTLIELSTGRDKLFSMHEDFWKKGRKLL